MPLRFKIDILEALKKRGYTTYSLRKENLLSQSTIQKLREGKGLAWDNISRICEMLNCQPGDILEYATGATAPTDAEQSTDFVTDKGENEQ